MAVADYADWGGLTELQNFLTSLNLAVQSDQATAAAIGTAVGSAISALDLAVQADQATAAQIASAISALDLALAANQATDTQIADAIAAAGVPLLHGYQLVENDTTWTAGAAGSYFSGVYTLPSPAYQFAIQVTISSASATIPFPRVSLSFFSAASSGVKVDEVDFYIPATSSGTYWIYGAGPAITPYVQVGVNNPDPAYTLSGQYVLGSSTLQRNRHDWRSAPGGTVPGYTLAPVSRPQGLILAGSPAAGTSVGAGDLVTYLLPLYAGQVYFTASLSVTPNPAAAYELQTPSGLFVSGGLTEIWTESSTATLLTSQAIALPRAPTLLTLVNNNGASAIVYDWSVTALEYAS